MYLAATPAVPIVEKAPDRAAVETLALPPAGLAAPLREGCGVGARVLGSDEARRRLAGLIETVNG